ncbi:MAG: acetyl/propionyl-CoA carboxylase alpha subunit/acetyl-CoA carboxylase carboxyltransferase component [Halocynthiibacter sp.]|jgi:acetyl/propionyl-CoA carboxylase alpha subunit/acetyl-CoA carboxylase carboxyltransferase component
MIRKLLIANRGEIAIRIARTAAEMGIATVAIGPADEALALHLKRADEAVELPGRGAAAYLDIEAVIAAGVAMGCDAVHPGYGFLSENAAFAEAAEAAGLQFIGPTPQSLALYGDKLQARALAIKHGVATLGGSGGALDLAGAQAFFEGLPQGASMILKAVAGGGGRGMKIVSNKAEIAEALARCASEAEAAFGSPSIYAERYLEKARHIEVQILGDGAGHCEIYGERECTLQRRHQKLIEIAPAPALAAETREYLHNAALTLANAGNYRSLGTFEFLVDPDTDEAFFIEANPRIQVEHTITEAIFGTDLVAAQLRLAMGQGIEKAPQPRGAALQTRVNMERIDAHGAPHPTGGLITAYDPPAGHGLRTDGFAYAGYETSSSYDGLLAKVIAHAPDMPGAIAKASRALSEFRIEGIETNIPYLVALLASREIPVGKTTTRFIDQNGAALAKQSLTQAKSLHFAAAAGSSAAQETVEIEHGLIAINAPMQATMISLLVAEGDVLLAGADAAILEAMKMEHVITAGQSGIVRQIFARAGETLREGAPIFAIAPIEGAEEAQNEAILADLDSIRPDLEEFLARRALGLDEARPEATAKRHARGMRTARENLASLVDEGTFNEYGALATAAQASRRSREDLEANTSGDGVVTGTGSINAAHFKAKDARVAFAICDYMVLAATQGQRHHRKLDRIFNLAGKHKLPVIHFAEGGGGRPGDSERVNLAGLDTKTFAAFARLSGQVPLVGVVAGRCFAGNAALLGCCDVIIATEDANIGMAGPAMIEGGGLGSYAPEDVGPIGVQSANGVVDIRVADEAEACEIARQYISYFQGDTVDWEAPDARVLRHVIPENRLRVHDIHRVIEGIADIGSVLELRAGWGAGMVTALVRIEGKAYGLIANNSRHLGGAIDADAADKAARFMQLCDAHGLPVLSLCDTPGFMVGPEAEKTALVRHVSRMFVVGASLRVPVFGVVLRKGYGLGAMAMLGGGFHEAGFTIAWPTGEFGGMGLEGAVRLGFRKELEALPDGPERQALFEELVAKFYANGKAVHFASALEIDAVIDPAETRQ